MPNYGWNLDPQDSEEDDTPQWLIPGLIPADDGMADEWNVD